MYGLYDKEGILRFFDQDKEVCIAYAELFELGSTNYCLIDFNFLICMVFTTKKEY